MNGFPGNDAPDRSQQDCVRRKLIFLPSGNTRRWTPNAQRNPDSFDFGRVVVPQVVQRVRGLADDGVAQTQSVRRVMSAISARSMPDMGQLLWPESGGLG